MATLPGIDANDEPKSLAAFRFYCCVLGALGQLPVSGQETPGGAGGAEAALVSVAALHHLPLLLHSPQLSLPPPPPPPLSLPPPPLLLLMLLLTTSAAPPPHPTPPLSPQEGPTAALPLLSEEWVDELLARCFAIISNLDSPEHRGTSVLRCSTAQSVQYTYSTLQYIAAICVALGRPAGGAGTAQESVQPRTECSQGAG